MTTIFDGQVPSVGPRILQLPQPDPDSGPQAYTYGRGLGASALAAIPAAHRAIGLLASTLARLPRTAARLEDPFADAWTPVPDHPVTALLEAPSRRMPDPWLFWESLFRALFASGNAYAWIRRDPRSGRPVELVPAVCRLARWAPGPVAEYDLLLLDGLRGLGEQITARAPDVLTLHGPGFDGLESPSPIHYAARQTLSVMALSGEHQRALLSGVNLRTAITIAIELLNVKSINPEQIQQFQDSLNESYAAARRKGQIPVFPPGFGLDTVGGLSAADIQLIELLKYSVEDVGRAFGVPPRMLGHFHEGAKVATTFEGHAVDFERWSVQEHVQRVQAQLTTKLVSAEDAATGLVVRMPADRIRAGSWTEQVRAVDQAVAKAGVMTINEGRRLLRLPPVPDGDRLLQPKGAPTQETGTEEATA